MVNKDEKKENWRVISQYLRGTAYRDAKTIKHAKDVFFGNEALGKLARSYVGLILSPEINDRTLSEIEDALRNDADKDSVYHHLQELQKSYRYYFGNNSLLNWKEETIFNYFQFVETNEFKERYSEKFKGSYRGVKKKSIDEYIDTSWFRGYLEKHTVPDHNQSWREVHRWEARLRSTPNDVKLDGVGEWTAMNLLSIELVNRHPDRFDSNVMALSKKAYKILTARDTPSVVKEYFQNLISEELNEFQIKEAVGSRLTVCVKYDTEDQLQASVEQLNPNTRCPSGSNNIDGKIYHLNTYEGPIRPSSFIINELWQNGLVATDVQCIDDRTLLFSLYVGTNYGKTLTAISTMFFDAYDIEKRYSSKKALKGDHCVSEAEIFTNSRVFEGLDGELFVSCDNNPGKIPVTSHSWLDRLAGNSNSAELAIELSSKSNLSKLRNTIASLPTPDVS